MRRTVNAAWTSVDMCALFDLTVPYCGACTAGKKPDGKLTKRAGRTKRRVMGRVSSTLAFLLPFALLVTAIVAVPLRILDEQGLPRYRALTQELREVDAQNDRLAREVRDLDLRVEALRRDPAAIERIARDELGMIRDGELVFQFPE